MPTRPTGVRRITSVLFWFGAAALLATLFLGWYTVSSSAASQTFYVAGVAVEQSGSGGSTNQAASYSDEFLPHVGALYEIAGGLVASAAALGLGVGCLIWAGWARTRTRILFSIAICAVLLAALGPALLAIDQPAAACADAQGFSPPLGEILPQASGNGPSCTWEFYLGDGNWYSPGLGSSGPQTSFVGSTSQHGTTMTWGPGTGWYLALAGTAFYAVGVMLSSRKDEHPSSDEDASRRPTISHERSTNPNPHASECRP